MTTVTAPATTGVLQMIRAEVNVREFQRWMGTRRLQDPDHAMHCLLTECFGPPPTNEHPENCGLAPQPFRLIVPRGGSTGCLYGYGQADADALRDVTAMCADPLQSRILPADRLDSKAMPTEWPKDKRLGFEIRVRPVVRLQKELARVPPDKLRLFRQDNRNGEREYLPRPGMECDVFQWKAMLYPKNEMPFSRERVYAEWLSRQFDRKGGATLDTDSVRLVAFQRTRSHRKLRARHVEGPDAVLRGVLTITDSAKFAGMLTDGIGRHRAYGYGMLLLRPARS